MTNTRIPDTVRAMNIPFISYFRQQRILGGAIVLACTQFGASLMGLIRDRCLAMVFPDLEVVDVYISAFRPSDLLFQMFIMAGFSVALVPLLAKYHANNDTKGSSELLSSIITIAAIVFGVIALIMGIFFEQIAPLFVRFEGETLEMYVAFGRIALLTNFLFVFGNAFGQYLITIQRYWLYGLTPIIYTAGTIAGTLMLSSPESLGVYGPIIGTLCGAFLYVIVRGVGVFATGGRFRFSTKHPDLKEMFFLMLPRMLALGALQFQLLLFDRVASGLPAGSVTINAYARNFQSVAVGIAGIALAQSAFSLLSQAAAKKEESRFWIYLKKGSAVLLAVTIPGAIALVLVTPIAASLVHLSHKLDIFSVCILLYAISIPFESMNHLLLRAFYSLKNTTIPAIFSVANGLTAIAVSWTLSSEFGVYALALGFTSGQILQLCGLGILLPKTVKETMASRSMFAKLTSFLRRERP